MTDIDVQRLWLFFGVLVALVTGFAVGTRAAGIDILALGPAYMFTPAIAGFVVCLYAGVDLSNVGLQIGQRKWLAISAVVWFPLLFLITALAAGVPGVEFYPEMLSEELGVPAEPLWLVVGLIGLVLLTLVAGVTINALIALGEEFGWRGYLLWELAPLGFWKASVVIGVAWGLWHAPLVLVGLNYPSFPVLGIAVFTVVCVVMSPIYTYVVVKSESVLAAAILHGVWNAAGFVGLTATDDPVLRELVASDGGLVGIVVIGLACIAIALIGPPKLNRDFAAHNSTTTS